MALGFKDCCNEFSYFYLEGIPATVSEFETYYIQTTIGLNFCAEYVNVPPLNYEPPTFMLLEMIEQTNCIECLSNNPCPTDENLIVNQFEAGAVVEETNCFLRVIQPLTVECRGVNPTVEGVADGIVKLFILGGTPPYQFFNSDNEQQIGVSSLPQNGEYTVISNVPEGTYNIVVFDSNFEYRGEVSCFLDAPPPPIQLLFSNTQVSIFEACDGEINFSIINGQPPFSIFLNGVGVTLPIQNLCAGNYTINIQDSGVGTDFQNRNFTTTITQPAEIIWPANICLTLTLCGTEFFLTFNKRATKVNFRAAYDCVNPESVGLFSLSIYWQNGWVTSLQTIQDNPQYTTPCGSNYQGQQFSFIKVAQTTEQPTGAWNGNAGATAGITATATSGFCPLSLRVISLRSYCPLGTPIAGQVRFVRVGGNPAIGINSYRYKLTTSATFIGTTNPIVSLNGGTYQAFVRLTNLTESPQVNFTVNSLNPPNFNQLVSTCHSTTRNDYTVNTNGTNAIDGPNEGKGVILTTTCSVSFPFLLPGSTVTAKLAFVQTSNFQGGDVNYNDPSIWSQITNTVVSVQVTTDGVTTSINPSTFVITYPAQSLTPVADNWYYFATGSVTCCPVPSSQGLIYRKTVQHLSANSITINNTTTISFTYKIDALNKVPFFNPLNCSASKCGGFLRPALTVQLQAISKPASSCVLLQTSSLGLFSYTYNLDSGNAAGNYLNAGIACP